MYEALRALRDDRQLSRSRLSRLTVQLGDEGIGEKTIEALESHPGRIPEATIIEALARALDVAPDTFYEYPIAVARRDLRAQKAEKRLGTGLEQEGRRQAGRHDDSGGATGASGGPETPS